MINNYIFILIVGLISTTLSVEASKPETHKYPVLAGDTISTEFDYYPPAIKNSRNRIPLIIIGGSSYLMFGGDKDDYKMIAKYYSEMGYSVFNLNYHKGLIPLPLTDLAYKGTQSISAGIKEIIYLADEFKIDPDKLTLFGVSAGGISSLMIATLDEDTDELFGVLDMSNRFGSLYGNSPHISIDINPRVVVTLGAAICDINQIDQSDIENCHFFLIHGENDRIVSPLNDLPFTELGDYFNLGIDDVNNVIQNVEKENKILKLINSLLGVEKWIERSKLKTINGSYLVAKKLQSIDSNSVKTLFLPGEDHTILFGNSQRVPSAKFVSILRNVDRFIVNNTSSTTNYWMKIKSIVGFGLVFMILLLIITAIGIIRFFNIK